MITVSKARHQFSGCPCGHPEHIGKPDLRDRHGWFVVCPVCAAVEQREHVIIATDTMARIEQLAIARDTIVRHDGQTCRVVAVEPVMRLGGAYETGFAIVKLREAAA